jgi:hypothetical protein
MCSICDDWEKGKLTSQEALQAAGEIMKVEDIHHVMELTDKIMEKEMPMKERDTDFEWEWAHEMGKSQSIPRGKA